VRQAHDGARPRGRGAPPAGEENKAAILAALRAAIAIASDSGALPLNQKAEAMLNEMLARGDELILPFHPPGVRSYRRWRLSGPICRFYLLDKTKT
jgi:hypothetical protein